MDHTIYEQDGYRMVVRLEDSGRACVNIWWNGDGRRFDNFVARPHWGDSFKATPRKLSAVVRRGMVVIEKDAARRRRDQVALEEARAAVRAVAVEPGIMAEIERLLV